MPAAKRRRTADPAVQAISATAGRVAAARAALPPSGPTTAAVHKLRIEALGLFAELGFHGTTVRDIARALDIKPASLYSLVESKDQLLADLVQLGHAAHAQEVEQAVVAADDDPASQLAAYVQAHVEFHARWSMLAIVTNNELHCLPPGLAQPSLDLRQRSVARLLQIIEAGRQSGEFDVGDAFLAAAAIGAMGMRVATWFDARMGYDVSGVAQEYAAFALRLVGARH